ncbi:DUF418 domain-containing protein [Bacillus fonticola]|uniref:DUF418 domain-containing protein n=1 Tax=Bacillus fonticola TaxID=2728853 RepID=UPI00147355F1|nr:DUF418 domain-containing protein [Bacillus fonticola]
MRVHSIDVTRGIALLGILLINVMSFHAPFLYVDPYTYWEEEFWLYSLIDLFVQGSFYPLFSLLFGFGTVFLFEKCVREGRRFLSVYIRRLLFLAIVGLLHGLFIWSGDILFAYALTGVVSGLFIKLPAKPLLIIGGLWFLVPQLLMGGLMFLASLSSGGDMGMPVDVVGIQQSIEAYRYGSWAEIQQMRFTDWQKSNGSAIIVFQIGMLVPFFLIGMGLAKTNLFRGHQTTGALTWFWILFTVGIAIKLIPYVTSFSLGPFTVHEYIGGPLVAFSIPFLVHSLVQNGRVTRVANALANMGKLSFTMYLLQSLIGTFVFYNIGFGLYSQVTLLQGTLFAIALYTVQVVAANLWMRNFQIGPFEFVWRAVTYGKRPEMKRDES